MYSAIVPKCKIEFYNQFSYIISLYIQYIIIYCIYKEKCQDFQTKIPENLFGTMALWHYREINLQLNDRIIGSGVVLFSSINQS